MNTHGIKVAVNKTGLSAHVLRVWEKRYGAVTPQRTETNRRLYTDEDIARLQTLVDLISKGYSIGQIATLDDSELHDLLHASISEHEQRQHEESTDHAQLYADAAMAAIRDYDQASLETTLDNATRELGYSGLLERVIIPVIQRIGDDWHSGHITAAGEHASSSFIKDYLANSVRAFAVSENAPVLVVTTPAGQLHELGVFIASCLARKQGWKIIYLGPSLPADEIAGAASRIEADAILLSITYPTDDPMLNHELKRLRHQAPEGIPILVGGTGIKPYAETLEKIGAVQIASMSNVSEALEEVRAKRLQD